MIRAERIRHQILACTPYDEPVTSSHTRRLAHRVCHVNGSTDIADAIVALSGRMAPLRGSTVATASRRLYPRRAPDPDRWRETWMGR